MREKPRRGAAFYVEIIVLLVFLLLSLTVLVRMLALARGEGIEAQRTQQAVQLAQDAAECFAASRTDAALAQMLQGSELADGIVTWQQGDCRVRVALSEKATAAGALRTADIAVSSGTKQLYTLQVQHYWAEEAAS